MKTLLCCAGAAALLFSAVSPCFAAGSPWDGTWKEDQAKSKLTGDTMTYTAKPGGQFHFSNGGTIEYDFACDGKPYTTLADRTITCSGSAASGYDLSAAAHGKVLSKSHRTFSADGKMMMIHGTAMREDGTTYDFDETYKRLSGTTGLAGRWLDIKDTSTGVSVMNIMVMGDTLHIEEPAYKETVMAKLDGSDGKVTGPDIPPGAVMTFKSESPTKLHFAVKLNGKVLYEGTRTLSADGKSFVEEEWVPGRMAEKSTVVYEKQ